MPTIIAAACPLLRREDTTFNVGHVDTKEKVAKLPSLAPSLVQ
jgi:hypothetical protein